IEALDMVVEPAHILARPDAIRRPVIADLAALEAYLDIPERTAQPPGISALLLNNRNQLLGEPAWEADELPAVLTQEMLKAALDQHATAAILVRNGGAAPPRIGETDRVGTPPSRRSASG